MTKPFSLRELIARIRVRLRRAGTRQTRSRSHAFGDVEIDLRARRVLKSAVEVPLTRKEFEILVLLVQRAGDVVTRDEFLNALWGEDVYVTHRTVDTHVATLRKKLEADPNNPAYVLGVRGVGYRFNETLLKT